jgi:hypothetical protein
MDTWITKIYDNFYANSASSAVNSRREVELLKNR